MSRSTLFSSATKGVVGCALAVVQITPERHVVAGINATGCSVPAATKTPVLVLRRHHTCHRPARAGKFESGRPKKDSSGNRHGMPWLSRSVGVEGLLGHGHIWCGHPPGVSAIESAFCPWQVSLFWLLTMQFRLFAWVCALTGAVSGASIPRGHPSKPAGPLRFNADGSFQISVLQDTHFGESKILPL